MWVAVISFFKSLDVIRRQIPGLTIVIATNDPREALYCERYVTVKDGVTGNESEQQESFKSAMIAYHAGISSFAREIGIPAEKVREPAALEIPSIPAEARIRPTWAFLLRGWRDSRKTPLLGFFVILSVVVPNLIGLFASQGERGAWAAVVLTSFGIYVSMCIRDASRFMSREQDYYLCLEKVLFSPVTRLQHFVAESLRGTLVANVYAALTVLLILVVFWGNVFEEMLLSWNQFGVVDGLGLVFIMLSTVFALRAIGLAVSYLPFITNDDQAYFVMSIIPTLVVLLSGIHFSASSLPFVFRHVAYANPVSYTSVCLDQFLGLGLELKLPLLDSVNSLFPVLSYGWLSALTLSVLALIYLIVASYVFARCEKFLLRIGRLRNNRQM